MRKITNRQLGLFVGPLLFILVLVATAYSSLPMPARVVAATAVLMTSWWLTEAIPIPATALLPLALFPVFHVSSMQNVATSYANHLIFLFLGGFLVAASIQRWNLHKRIALNLIVRIGSSPARIILGFMLASAFLSMWVSNTATAMLMLPIGMALIQQINNLSEATPFGSALMLGIAYACSIGGVATLVGTPPNAIFAGIAEEELKITIGFFEWFRFAFPMALAFLIICWYYLVHIRFKLNKMVIQSDKQILLDELNHLGKVSSNEKRVLLVFLFTALAWVLNGILHIEILKDVKDSTIAIVAACALFIIPAHGENKRLLDWETARNIPWDILILFGGGFALAAACSHSGLMDWLADQLTILKSVNELVLIIAVTTMVIFLTEITSNTATATIFIPLMLALATAVNLKPFLLMLPVAIAASYAFMLPVATPPNAIVFSSRQLDIMTMAKTGFALNLIAILIIVVTIWFFKPLM